MSDRFCHCMHETGAPSASFLCGTREDRRFTTPGSRGDSMSRNPALIDCPACVARMPAQGQIAELHDTLENCKERGE